MGEHMGKLITFEGIEGCGKSTQQRLLSTWLQNQDFEVVVSKEPGGTTIGKHIREILLHVDHDHMAPSCEALLYLADRAQHHAEVIKPALARSAWILCDRYHDSTLAYQGAARGLGAAELNAIFAVATGNLKPHLTLLLDMDPDKGLQRARARNHQEDTAITEGRFEEEHMTFHQQVRAGFLALAAAEPQRFEIIDADRSPEEVATSIRAIITQRWQVTHV